MYVGGARLSRPVADVTGALYGMGVLVSEIRDRVGFVGRRTARRSRRRAYRWILGAGGRGVAFGVLGAAENWNVQSRDGVAVARNGTFEIVIASTQPELGSSRFGCVDAPGS